MSNENDGSADFERRAKRVFDDSVAALDAATRSKLTQARFRALEEQESARDRGWRSSLVPAGTVAATALVAFLVMWQQPADPTAPVDTAPLGDLEILLGEEDLEMLEEEIEFDGWLEHGVYSGFLVINGTFQGPLSSDSDRIASQFSNGVWSLAVDMGNGGCNGTWSAAYPGPWDGGLMDAGPSDSTGN